MSRVEILLILEQRESRLMFLIFWNEMKQRNLMGERETVALKMRRNWSIIDSSSQEQLAGVIPEQRIRPKNVLSCRWKNL